MSDRFSWRPWALPLGLFLLGLAFAAGLVFFAWHYSLASLQQDIAKQADLVRDDFNRRISAIDEVSANSAIFVNSTLLLDGDEFRIFAEHIFNRYSFFCFHGILPPGLCRGARFLRTGNAGQGVSSFFDQQPFRAASPAGAGLGEPFSPSLL